MPAQIELPGVPLGSFAGSTYDEVTFDLAAGDLFVFCRDGVFEAFDGLGREFGAARLIDVVEATRERSAREIVDAIFAAVHEFRGDESPNDDMTAVAIKSDSCEIEDPGPEISVSPPNIQFLLAQVQAERLAAEHADLVRPSPSRAPARHASAVRELCDSTVTSPVPSSTLYIRNGTSGTPHELVTTPSMLTERSWYRPGLSLSSEMFGLRSARPQAETMALTAATRARRVSCLVMGASRRHKKAAPNRWMSAGYGDASACLKLRIP